MWSSETIKNEAYPKSHKSRSTKIEYYESQFKPNGKSHNKH